MSCLAIKCSNLSDYLHKPSQRLTPEAGIQLPAAARTHLGIGAAILRQYALRAAQAALIAELNVPFYQTRRSDLRFADMFCHHYILKEVPFQVNQPRQSEAPTS
jgi:hypothetical protein